MQDQLSVAINNRIEALRADHIELASHLRSNGELGLLSRVEEGFSKTLLIAVASYFEVRLSQIIVDLYREATQDADVLTTFVRKQAIGTRFAQLFRWGDSTANSFYRLFGDGFYAHMTAKVRSDLQLSEDVRAFLEIGNLRNQMVHGNYADFQLNKTVNDVVMLYENAARFVEGFPEEIRAYLDHHAEDSNSVAAETPE